VALVQCRECGIEVSSEAPTCPRCGVPQPASALVIPGIRGIDPDTHRWAFEQLMAGVPREPLARRLSDGFGMSRKGAREIVGKIEAQALRSLEPPRSVRRGGGNVAPALLSLWIPGLGQLTQGRVGRAFALFGGAALLWMILLGWVMHITAAVDAARWDPVD